MKRFCARALVGRLLSAAAGCGSTPVRTVTGEQTFATHCASCHGASGVFPADRAASYIDGRALPAAHGVRSMPVWSGCGRAG